MPRRQLLRFLFAFWLLAALVRPAPSPAADRFTLTIVHTNDVHSRLLASDPSGRPCLLPGEDCAGGMARAAAVVRALREGGEEVLLLDAGDQFTGTILFQKYKGAGAARVMTRMGYDAMVPGNHELDLGPGGLAAFLDAVSFPMLSANMHTGDVPALQGRVVPYAVFERGGRTIGVVGATTPETAYLVRDAGGVAFSPVRPAVRRAVDALRNAGVDIVVCLTHQGYAQDKLLAATVPGIDVVVGGHSHVSLGPGAEYAGPYPSVTRSPGGAPSLVVTNGKWTSSIGVLRVTFDAAGVPVRWRGRPEPLPADLEPDPAVQEELDALRAGLEGFLDEPAGATAAPVTATREACRHGECPMGDLVADAMLAATERAGARLALVNAGAIRNGLPGGDLTLADVSNALPFGNAIVLVTLTGRDIVDALEHGVRRAAPGQEGQGGTGRFLQVAGIRYAWTPDNAPGSRILAVDVRDGRGGYEALVPDAEYRVAVNGYLAGGGDGFNMVAARTGSAYETSIPVVQAVRDLLTAKAPVRVEEDGRILTMEAAD